MDALFCGEELPTYDPKWEKRYEAANTLLTHEQARNRGRSTELLQRLVVELC